jgi:aldose sugar dehydrogenase
MSLPARRLLAVTATLALTASGLIASAPPSHAAEPVITKVADGLRIPWDVTWVGETMLVNERAGRLWSLRTGGQPQRVTIALPPIFNSSEGGLLGMVAHPDAARNGLFYTCQSVADGKGKARDVQVWQWRLTDSTHAEKVRTILTGIPIGSGRHNGCRLRFRSADRLYIATGDAATSKAPQDLKSLGGKVLRVRADGSAPSSNPFYRKGGKAKYVWTYGHRNVQGLAFRGSPDQLWSAEHGPSRDDEVNRIIGGTNYGWSPGSGYNENRSMTDTKRFKKAKKARWRSGKPTVAISGATFLQGAQWGSWNGYLAVARLKGHGISLFRITGTETLTEVTKGAPLAAGYDRIRTVQQGPDGALYFTTSNDTGTGAAGDGVYRLTLAS